LKRLIQDKILTKVAHLLVSRGILQGGEVLVTVGKNEIGEEDMEFSLVKKGKVSRRSNKKETTKV